MAKQPGKAEAKKVQTFCKRFRYRSTDEGYNQLTAYFDIKTCDDIKTPQTQT